MSDIWTSLHESLREGDRHRRQLDEAFKRLLAEPCMKPVKVGDLVVVAAGLLGKGLLWQRTECTVIAVGDTSVKVRFTGDSIRREDEMWIHPVLITDNLGPQVDPCAACPDDGTSPASAK